MATQDSDMIMTKMVLEKVKIYSILVGLLIVLVCVLPCVLFALMAKCFQKQNPRRKSSTIRSLITGMKVNYDTKDEVDFLGATGFGAFGQIQMPVEQISVIQKISSYKNRLPCMTVWKAYSPNTMNGSDQNLSERRLVMVKKLDTAFISDVHDNSNHNGCIKAELSILSQIPPHHLLLNLLGVISNNSSPVALIMEYSPYGILHTYLVIKWRAHISNNNIPWGGLKLIPNEELAVKGLPEIDRPHISTMLDDYEMRRRAFNIPISELFSEVDVLLFMVQIASALQFLIDNECLHKRLSTENIVIGPGFYLKLMGMDFDPPQVHRTSSNSKLRRTASGRNLVKWDAPEVFESCSYSEQSEIWRFAMTSWEICSLGQTPFTDIPTRALGDVIKKGSVPPKPDGTSQSIYSLISSCWAIEPLHRPTFTEIIENINSLLRHHEYSTDDVLLDAPASQLVPTAVNTHTPLEQVSENLHLRPARRPILLPLDSQDNGPSIESQGNFIGTTCSGESTASTPGYLETDV